MVPSMKNHPVLWFYVLTFAFSWFGWSPMVAGSHGITPFEHPLFQIFLLLPAVAPALAAVIVTATNKGKLGVDCLFRPLGQWRVGLVWLMIATIAPALFMLSGKTITQVLGLSANSIPVDGNIVGVAIATFVMSLLSNTWEEVGWRGFALPRLQKNHSALAATLVVGVLWGMWHVPLFLWQGHPMSNYPFLEWFIGTIAVSFIYTWLYNSTRGSLFVVTIFHVLTNTYGVLVSGVSVAALAMVYSFVALCLVAIFGKNHLAR